MNVKGKVRQYYQAESQIGGTLLAAGLVLFGFQQTFAERLVGFGLDPVIAGYGALIATFIPVACGALGMIHGLVRLGQFSDEP